MENGKREFVTSDTWSSYNIMHFSTLYFVLVFPFTWICLILSYLSHKALLYSSWQKIMSSSSRIIHTLYLQFFLITLFAL